nr:metallo-endopeptidase IrrE [Deinococcus radiodurans]
MPSANVSPPLPLWGKGRGMGPKAKAEASKPHPQIPVKLPFVTAPDALAAAKARMRDLAAAYVAALPGRDTHSLMAGVPGVDLKFMPLGWRDGAFDPEHNVILINSAARPERQRFTLAHEIGHAILLGDDDLLSDIHDAYEGERLEQVIETLCNVAAAAILMPEPVIAEMLERFGPTGRALAELAKRAEVSASSALYALTEQTPVPVIYAVCAPGKPPREQAASDEDAGPSTEKVLTVRASSSTRGVKYTLASGTPVPADHPAALALATGMEVREESYVPFRSGRKMKAEVDAYPSRGIVAVSFEFDPARLGRKDSEQADRDEPQDAAQ